MKNYLQIIELQRELKFVPWMPSGFKIGIVSERFNLLPDSPFEGKPSKSLTKICNHGCVVQVFERFKKKFEIIQERISGEWLEVTIMTSLHSPPTKRKTQFNFFFKIIYNFRCCMRFLFYTNSCVSIFSHFLYK